MKRIIIAIAALTLLCAPASAQGFLDRIRKQVEETIGNAAREEAEDNIPDDVRTGMDRAEGSMQMVTGEQALPPRRYSTFGWDGPVTPSAAKFPIPLMNEFPAVPGAKELANPTEANQIAYYKAIKAVTLRAEELNQDTTCEDQETLLWREKSNKMLKETFGLTDEEIAMLERDDLTEEEQERLNDKMTRALLGDIDTAALEQEAAEMEGKSQDEVAGSYMDKSQKATFEVYDRNAADIKKYMGVTADEMKAASRAQYQYRGDGQCPEMTALQKKTEAYQKEQSAKDPNFRKEADAFEQKMRSETLKALQGSSALGGLIGSIGKATQKVSPIVEMEQKMATYVAQMQKLMWVPDSQADARFSASDRRKLESIKEKIYSTEDPSVYNPLFAEASELIATYRERAAKVWAEDVQKRFNAMKENLPELIKLNRQAVADELIPECALWRMPLNYVVSGRSHPGSASEQGARQLCKRLVPGILRLWVGPFRRHQGRQVHLRQQWRR
jgi:hypothetical protein